MTMSLIRFSFTRTRACLVGLLLLAALTSAAYILTIRRLDEARLARREDDCGLAEDLLASCWRLPGLRASLELEEQLLAVQQGDLHDETAGSRELRRRRSGR